MTIRQTLNITSESFKELKKAHAAAKAKGETEFTFHGVELDTGYAGYLIEYLEPTVARWEKGS